MSDSKRGKKWNQSTSCLPRRCASKAGRFLRYESLEDRRLLAVFSVNQLTDSSVVAVGDAPGTLRQALFDAKFTSEPDTINFQSGLSGTLLLTAGELKVTDSVTIVGPGADQITIDAAGNDLVSPGTKDGSGSRVLFIDDNNVSAEMLVEVSGLTLSGGDVSGDGGAIWSREDLVLTAVKIEGNAAVGPNARGGGIFSYGGNLSIDRSTISGNTASGTDANGGGVFSTTQLFGAQTTSITNSTIRGNHASGNGGGIFTGNNLTEDQTTSIKHSTISGNTAGNSGGGLFNFDGSAEVNYTTITANSAPAEFGGGVASFGDIGTMTLVSSSIVSGNIGVDLAVFAGEDNSLQSTGFNVVGTGNSFGPLDQFSALDNFAATGDQTNILDPGLETLASNGGLTFTHALTSTSVALDAGDPAAQANIGDVPEFDQRLAPFGRIRDGNGNGTARIDVGAFEVAAESADFDDDGDVDGRDFLAWQRGFGTVSGAQREDGDADSNGAVNAADLNIWRSTYGMPIALQAVVSITQQYSSSNAMEGDADNNLYDLAVLFSSTTDSVSTLWITTDTSSSLGRIDDAALTSSSKFAVMDSHLAASKLATSAQPSGTNSDHQRDDGKSLEFQAVDELFQRLASSEGQLSNLTFDRVAALQ